MQIDELIERLEAKDAELNLAWHELQYGDDR